MKLFSILIFLIFSFLGFSQDTITATQAKDFIGKEIVLKGKIASVKMAGEGKSTNYINVDFAYPNSVFTVVIPNYALDKLSFKIEDSVGKQIIVKGKVQVYDKDVKQIPQIFNPGFIQVK
ncbi:MAG: hypothetical protein H7221_09335 [Flavobacterium sp.]|nr:hypothetical protein [Flavobacterium sp.]